MSNLLHLKKWLGLSDSAKLKLYTTTGEKINLSSQAIEKDWWLVHTLALIFSMDCAKALVFKGGTSLSKAWNIIERFSEDIDLALDKAYLGFTETEPSKKKVNELRRLSFAFITQEFAPQLQAKFIEAGLKDVQVKCNTPLNDKGEPISDQDPLNVEIYYPSLTEEPTYLRPNLLVEIGSRSLREPYTLCTFGTLVGKELADKTMADEPVAIPTVNPERTFLEKVFLLHEEFQRPAESMRVNRLSRHLYDIERLMRTEFVEKALQDKALYEGIVKHRSIFSKLSGVDYEKHAPQHIAFVPPDALLPAWKQDYEKMQESMIYGESLAFAELMTRLQTLQNRIRQGTFDS